MKGSSKYYKVQKLIIFQLNIDLSFSCCTKSTFLLDFRSFEINQLTELRHPIWLLLAFLGIIYCLCLIKRHIGVLYKTQYDHGVAVQILQHSKKELMGVTGTTIRPQETEKQLPVQLPRYAKYAIRLDRERVTGTGVRSKSILLSINSSKFLSWAQLVENLAEFVKISWEELPEEKRQEFREFVSNQNSKTGNNHNLFSNFKLNLLMFWIRFRCSKASISAFTNASRHLTEAITKAVKLENSAEVRAIERLASTDNPLEWDTITEPDEDINIEEMNEYLRTRGYNIQIPRESSPESQ
jgi:hypothetical protein